MRLFLAAHRTGRPSAGIEQARFLVDAPAFLQYLDLAPRFMLDGLANEADRVDVLDLAACAQRLARAAYRNIDVRPQRTLFHVPDAGTEIAQNAAQFRHIR